MDILIFENYFLLKITLCGDIKDFIQIVRALFIETLKNHRVDTLFESVSHE